MFEIDLVSVYEEAHQQSKRWLNRVGTDVPGPIIEAVKGQMKDLEATLKNLKMLITQYKLNQ